MNATPMDLKAIRAEEIRKVWSSIFPTIAAPSEFQIRTWLCHSNFTISLGLREAARAFYRLQSTESVVRFASKCMSTRSKVLQLMKAKEKITMPEQYDYSKFSRAEVEAVFGPRSNSLEAARMAKFEPTKYAALKQAGVYLFGLISESMLPRASQLTREQREAKTRADLAAQKDETFQLPEPLAARLGVPADTKVSWDTLQRLLGRKTD